MCLKFYKTLPYPFIRKIKRSKNAINIKNCLYKTVMQNYYLKNYLHKAF